MRRIVIVATSTAVVFVLGVLAAIATPAREVTKTDIARAVLVNGGVVDHEPGRETTVHHLSIAPGGSSGWHSHHGSGAFLVMSGTLTNYGLDGAACDAVEVKAGEAYFLPPHPHHPHLVLNRGSEPLELTLVYFNVPPGEPTRLDEEAPAECPADLR